LVERKLVRSGEVWLVVLDPTLGSEIKKTRPCVIVSPDEMNDWLSTVIVAPMTTTVKPYPTRVSIRFKGKPGQAALDQIRTVDSVRLAKRLGALTEQERAQIADRLVEMFRLR